MTYFLQLVVSGLSMGSIYAFLALALVLIYRSTGIVNFSQGEIAMFSTFVTWTFYQAGFPILVALGLSIALAFLAGGLLEFLLIRRVISRSDHHGSVIITVGLFVIFNNLAGAIWLYDPQVLRLAPNGIVNFGIVRITYQTLLTFAVLMTVLLALYLLFKHTRLGLAVRATVSNRMSADLSGIDTSLMLMLGWCLAATLGALAGALVAPSLFLSPNMMAPVLAYALASAALGGFDSLPGAVLGAMIIGVSESLASAYIGFIGSDLKVLVPVGVLLVVLLVRPQGILGKKAVQRV